MLCCIWQLCTMIRERIWAVFKDECWFRFRLSFMHLFRFCFLCVFLVYLRVFSSCVVWFCCVRFSFFWETGYKILRDWLGRKSLKWPVLCQVGRKTLTQSITNRIVPPICIFLELTCLFSCWFLLKHQRSGMNFLLPLFVQPKPWIRPEGTPKQFVSVCF